MIIQGNLSRMHYKTTKIKHSFSNEGFTYIEVVVSLVIISLVAGLIYFSYAVSFKSLNSSKNRIKTEIIRINTDTLLRKNIESISIPFWDKEYDYSFSDNTIKLGRINGSREPYEIKLNDSVIITSCNPLKNKADKITGFEIRYQINGKEFETSALFASHDYGELEI